MPPKVPMREIGTATLGMIVDRTLRKKRKTTRMTNPMEISNVICTSRTEARIVVVAFKTTESLIVGGIEARNDGNKARTRSPGANTLHRVGDGGDIGQAYWTAILIGDYQRPVAIGCQQLVGSAQRPGMAS